MKIRDIFAAAGLVIAAMGVGTAAEARPSHGDRWEAGYHDNGRHRGWDRQRGWDRRDDRRWNRHGNRHARHCWTEWRHHHRVRVCR